MIKIKLYIIGNGFDIHHGLDTNYTSFGFHLKRCHNEIYNLFINYFQFDELLLNSPLSNSDSLWSEFETNMSKLDFDLVLEDNMDTLPNYASDSFRDRDRYIFQIEMERIKNNLTKGLHKAFKEFILDVEFPEPRANKNIKLDSSATFLSFNYTDTLCKYYEIHPNNILFIHGRATDNYDNIIIGHGLDPKSIKNTPIKPPTGLTEEELGYWQEYQSEQYDYSFDLAKNEIYKYISESFKGTDKIIKKNNDFFLKISEVSEVYVLGHSLSEVDLPYFHQIKKSVKKNSKWTATYYSPKSKLHHFNALKNLGVSDISIVRLEDIQ